MTLATLERDWQPGISAVLPVHDHCARLEDAILDVAAVLDGLVGSNFELIVVDDASSDATPALLDDLALRRAHLPLRVVRHASRRGFPSALASGFDVARHELLFCTPADGRFDVCELNRLLDTLDEQTDLVIGYRDRHAEGIVDRLSGWSWNTLVRLLFGPTGRDVECAFKLLRHEVWLMARACSQGAAFNTELLVKARRHGFRAREVPVRQLVRPRAHAGRWTEPAPLGGALFELVRLRRELDAARCGEPAARVPVGPHLG
jgi:glycosyltransferase involved in cell wall biosynthesis